MTRPLFIDMKFLLLALLLTGCAFEKGVITPREITCYAECTPEKQYIECTGQSEGTQTHSLEVQQ